MFPCERKQGHVLANICGMRELATTMAHSKADGNFVPRIFIIKGKEHFSELRNDPNSA